MKIFCTILAALSMLLPTYARELKLYPDISTTALPTAKDAEGAALKYLMNIDGLSATASLEAKTYFVLGYDEDGIGKRGDVVWQVHLVEFGETKRIAWVNAETGATRFIYPEKK